MHTAAAAVAWAVWAVWICNYRLNGNCDQERADFGPLFFFPSINAGCRPRRPVKPFVRSDGE
jgi:hypothetical protein